MTSTTADAGGVRVGDAAATAPLGSAPEEEPATEAPTSFLPLPPPLADRARRTHRVVLGLLMLFGIVQGAYWSFTTVVWNPVDEVAHYGYVESLATGHGVPTVGVSLLNDETLDSFKQSPTLVFRSNPYQPVASDENWGGTRHQYEAVHGPTYYVAMVPAYWLGRPFGDTGSLYAIRLATVLLTVLAVPLTWMLAKRLFPDRPVVWLLAPGLLMAVNALFAGSVSNDAMVLVLSLCTTLLFLRALDRPKVWWHAAAAGALFGLTIVTKMTSLVLIPFLAIAFLAWVVSRRPKVLAVARFVGLFVAGAVVTFGPWLAWNLRTYHATSAAAVVDGITGSALPSSQLGVDAIVQHANVARPGVWLSQLLVSDSYQHLWEAAVVVALVAGVIAAATRRRWRDAAVLVWCGSALPLAFLSMEVIVFVLFGGTGGPMGRHLIAALAPTLVMVAAAVVFVVGSRWAPPVVAALVAGTLVLQAGVARSFVDGTYLRASIDHRLAPATYQDWADAAVLDRTGITIDAGCPVEVLGIGFMVVGSPDLTTTVPPSVEVRTADGSTVTATGGAPVYEVPTYRLPEPVEGPLTVEVPAGTLLRASSGERDGEVGFTTGTGDPVATAYCAAADGEDADQRAFSLIYSIGHPDVISLGALRLWPWLEAAAAVVVAIGLAVVAARPRRTAADAPPAASADAASSTVGDGPGRT